VYPCAANPKAFWGHWREDLAARANLYADNVWSARLGDPAFMAEKRPYNEHKGQQRRKIALDNIAEAKLVTNTQTDVRIEAPR
jgi:hypothetical protein